MIAVGLLVATAVSFVGAAYPTETSLQNIPTVPAVVALVWADRRWGMTRGTFYGCVGFLALHIFGARWIYSLVPYDDWAGSWLGVRPTEVFGWRRNHYDRLVHFASGLFGLPPAAELIRRWGGVAARPAIVLSVAVVLSVGAIYEVFEWRIAVTMSPAHAEAYNGQQGDVWDPQKDMALAGIGAFVAAVVWWPRGSGFRL